MTGGVICASDAGDKSDNVSNTGTEILISNVAL